MSVSLAIVHHANQFLITNGYDNREGLDEVLTGKNGQEGGIAHILSLHYRYGIPANIHISGTLLEAIAWHKPDMLEQLRALYRDGLVEFIGSCYGQNIMRFSSYEHNLRQLNEELYLHYIHLGVDPTAIKIFWPPERVWDTECLAPVLTDSRLLNNGYQAVLIDDRVLLPVYGPAASRHHYDQEHSGNIDLFHAHPIKNGQGLVALPISITLRHNIPPRDETQWDILRMQLDWLLEKDVGPQGCDSIAIYADDCEKVAGIGGWDEAGPSQYEAFLSWIQKQDRITVGTLANWLTSSRIGSSRLLHPGTFYELAQQFGAGEHYEGWYYDPQWTPYRHAFTWTEGRIKLLAELGADAALIELAEKHLLISGWETAWHTPSCGIHGDPQSSGSPSPWARALTSHSRHAALIAEAAYWMRHRDEEAHAYFYDIDGDGESEIILKNDQLFAVITPTHGARLIALFYLGGSHGAMVIGNPSDDWNWQEELNRFMEIPRNHPGALADVGFELDHYQTTIVQADGVEVRVRLTNVQPMSAAYGLTKELALTVGARTLDVRYQLPKHLTRIAIDYGLSPDYLRLLRYGSCLLREYTNHMIRGWSTGTVRVWIEPQTDEGIQWDQEVQNTFGHGCLLRLLSTQQQFTFRIGVDETKSDVINTLLHIPQWCRHSYTRLDS